MNSYQQKIKAKDDEKRRIWRNSSAETDKLNSALQDFLAEKKHLHDISEEIDSFQGGADLEKIDMEVATVIEKVRC